MHSSLVSPGYYAAIDLGTVTCRMLVAYVDEQGALHEIERTYNIINLGEGVDAAGTLSQEAIQRAAQTISAYRRRALELVAQASVCPHPSHSQNRSDAQEPQQGECADATSVNIIAVATSAARDASNKQQLVDALAEYGVPLHIIPGQLEAELSFRGASLDFAEQNLLVVDVGGGSTEVVFGSGGNAPAKAHSFNVGCRRMTERYLLSDPPSSAEISEARAWVQSTMNAYFDDLENARCTWSKLVAVAGTATTVVSVHEQMQRYDSAIVHGYNVSKQVLENELDKLATMTLEQRKQVVGLDPRRASVIVAGLIILSEVMDLAGVDAYTASETDILQGTVMAVAQGRSFD